MGKSEMGDNIFNSDVYLNFDSLNGHGIKYENIEEFGNSYFRDAYYDAFMLTGKIVEESSEYVKRKRSFRRSQERLYNIITFCGERGAGKTSVMNSFIGALQSADKKKCKKFIENYEESKNNKTLLADNLANCEFVCLDEIDASLLEPSEEILDVVLAKMFQYFRSNSKAYSKNSFWGYEQGGEYIPYGRNDIIARFEEIYRNKHELSYRNNQSYSRGESAVETMSSLSGSLAIRDKFQQLIPMYLKAISPDDTGIDENNKFLVITIDDLDMNASGYEMLEQIHRYMMVPGVIIYLAVSGKELQAVCKKHFEKIYDNQDDLAMPYLEKVLPFSQRIYLPVLLNNSLDIRINPDNLSIKETLLRKIVRRTGVFYDGQGLKNHFYEVDNLRTLVNFYYFLDHMKKIEDIKITDEFKKQKQNYIADSNIEKLKTDVVNRLAVKKLNETQNKVFQTYYKEDAVRRGEFFIDWIAETIKEGKYVNDYRKYGYSYGELLRGFYILGKEKKEYKPLIHCILAFETLTMTQLYLQAFKDNPNEQASKKWEACISDSIGGSWTNHLLPEIKEKDQSSTIEVGYKTDLELEWSINCEIDNSNPYETCKEILSKPDMVSAIEMMSMFITKRKDLDGNGDQFFKLEKSEIVRKKKDASDPLEVEYIPEMKIIFRKFAYTFDVLGFVFHSMNSESFFGEIYKEILNATKDYCIKEGDEWTSKKERELLGVIKKNSMWKVYKKWFGIYSGMAMPVYSTDIMYNIVKRVKNSKDKKFPRYINSQETLSYIKKCYDDIEKKLHAEDEFYCEKNGKECGVHFKKAFSECPFIKKIRSKNDKFITIFDSFIAEVLLTTKEKMADTEPSI